MISRQSGEHRPRLILIAYFYPPAAAIASVRAYCIAKYLCKLGWSVSVVTPSRELWQHADLSDLTTDHDLTADHDLATDREESSLDVIESEHPLGLISPKIRLTHEGRVAKATKRVAVGLAVRVLPHVGLDYAVGWSLAAYRACRRLRVSGADVVLATGGPYSSFFTARAAARLMKCPYVLDYRDLWYDNPDTSLDTRAVKKIEASMVAGADGIITVSESCATALGTRYAMSAPIEVVTNGYDPERMDAVKAVRFDHNALIFAGRFFPPVRTADAIMRLLAELASKQKEDSPQWLFHYYGPNSEYIRSLASDYGVQQYVVDHGLVDREEALAATAGARASIVVTNITSDDSHAARSIVTGKLFEALGLGTPVLLIGDPSGDAARILGSAGRCFRPDDIGGMESFVSGLTDGSRTRSPVKAYSWPVLAEKLDLALRASIARHGARGPQASS